MAGKRGVAEIQEFCGWDALLAIVAKAKSLRDKAIIATLFLTGGRVSEVLKLTKDHFDLSTKPDVIVVRKMPVHKRYKKIGTEIVNGKKKTITEKVHWVRTFPIMRNEPLSPYLIDYLATLKPGATLFPLTRVRMWQIVNKLCGEYNHWFRAQRSCQLVEEHDFQVNEIMDFFQWRDMKTAMRYTSLGWLGLARRQGAKV